MTERDHNTMETADITTDVPTAGDFLKYSGSGWTETADITTDVLLDRDRVRINAAGDGLDIPGDMSVEEFAEAFNGIKMAEKGLYWSVADLLVYAKEKWGDQFIRNLKLSKAHSQILRTGELFPPGTRFDALTPRHHQICQELRVEPSRARKALQRAADPENNWSTQELRLNLRRTAPTVVQDRSVRGAVDQEYMAFQKAQTYLLKNPPQQLSDIARKAMMARLRGFVDYFRELEALELAAEGGAE